MVKGNLKEKVVEAMKTPALFAKNQGNWQVSVIFCQVIACAISSFPNIEKDNKARIYSVQEKIENYQSMQRILLKTYDNRKRYEDI